METATLNGPIHPVAWAIVASYVKDVNRFNFSVHDRDEVLGHDLGVNEGNWDVTLAGYFQTGFGICHAWRQIVRWHFGSFDRVTRLLDFASGYGRVTRFLLEDLPPNRLWVSDIQPEALDFQTREFGVHTLASVRDPAEFSSDVMFDCILATSFFTHLPEKTFMPWLKKLFTILSPGGLLLFTVHDESLFGPEFRITGQGLLFRPISESRGLDEEHYGRTWVSERFVRNSLRSIGKNYSVLRIPRGLLHFQDIYVVVDEPGVDFSRLHYEHGAEGYLEVCTFQPDGQLRLSGWAASRGSRVTAIEVLLNGEVLLRCEQFHERPDVAAHFASEDYRLCGWAVVLRLPPRSSSSFDVLVVRARVPAEPASILYAGSLDAAVLRSVRAAFAESLKGVRDAGHYWSLIESREATAGITAQLAKERVLLGELEARLNAMQQSRFWKLRNFWFRIKSWARLFPSRSKRPYP